jgi:hypothetical protein
MTHTRQTKKITNSPRASRRIPVLFFDPQKVALIESMIAQWQDLSEERRRPRTEAVILRAKRAQNDSLKDYCRLIKLTHYRTLTA